MGSTITITIALFDAELRLPNDTTACKEDGLLLHIESEYFDEIIWENNVVGSNLFVTESGQYQVTGVKEDCTITDTIYVELEQCEGCVLHIPNAFTPNNDAVNDAFSPVIYDECQRGIEIQHITIWSRWGKKIFTADGPNFAWDGTFQNENAAADVYFYQIWAINKEGEEIIYQGDVTLIG